MTGIPHWQTLVEHLNLQPHPEGGYYRETFRSDRQISFNGDMRSTATAIYYLLAQGAYSAWHRIDADESWYFHAGCPLVLSSVDSNWRERPTWRWRYSGTALGWSAIVRAAVRQPAESGKYV